MKQLTKLFGLTVACSALFVLGCSGEDGVAGPKGEPGQPGANGKNCTTYSNDDANTYTNTYSNVVHYSALSCAEFEIKWICQ